MTERVKLSDWYYPNNPMLDSACFPYSIRTSLNLTIFICGASDPSADVAFWRFA